MIKKLEYSKCTLCKSCINSCPKKCIRFEDNNTGFMYPIISNSECIKCGICEKKCPILTPLNSKNSNKKAYVAKSIDDNIRLNSSSGGIFSVLAKYIISCNGVVCGAKFGKDFTVKHSIIDKEEELKYLRGSKYVQSDIENTYIDINNKLKSGRKVLFSGCPCQIAGLKGYLRKEYDNLYLIDFICHGIPSQAIFNEYLNILRNKYKSDIVNVIFRDKSKGWHESSVKVIFENGKIYIKTIYHDMYMRGFLNNFYLKESCHNCQFREGKSGSDLTIADYWGAEIEAKEMDDNKGLSLVIANTNRGEELLNKINENILLKVTDFHRAIKYNKSFIESSKENKDKTNFFELAEKRGYKKAFYKYCKEKNSTIIKRNIRMAFGRVKRVIKI